MAQTTENKPKFERLGKPERQLLPFAVAIAKPSDLAAIAKFRAKAYGKHLPEFGSKLAVPEAADFEEGAKVVFAYSRLDGTVLGTFRFHTNDAGQVPLQSSIDLPGYLSGKRLSEAVRLCIKGGDESSLVRSALFKAYYLLALQSAVDYLVVVGRRPVDRMYDALMFQDIGEPGARYPMAHVGGIPHRVMSFDMATAEQRWRDAQHPLYHFAVNVYHPDIQLVTPPVGGGVRIERADQVAELAELAAA